MSAALQQERSRSCGCGGGCDRCGKTQRNPAANVPPSVQKVVASPGQPLDTTTRARLEPRFGHDFSRVRVHSDASAAASVADVRAQAYTFGNDIAFAPGRYRPGTPLGDAILAHELAHVMQQDGHAEAVATKGESSSSALEHDADASAAVAARSLWGSSAKNGAMKLGEAAPRLRTAARLSLADCSGSKEAERELEEEKDKGQAQVPEGGATTTAEPPPSTELASPPTDFVLAGATKKQWRVKYKNKSEADAKRNLVKKLHIKVEEATQGQDKLWTFEYWPLTRDKADAERAVKEKAFGPKYDVTTRQSTTADTWYVDVLRKCPEGMDPKPGFQTWPSCLPSEADANALVKKMKNAHVEAESSKVDEGRWGVYYKPMTAAEAQTAGQAEAAKRAGFAEGMYKVTTSEKPDVKSHTWAMTTSCPPGWTLVGSNFLITAYVLAQESEFPATPTVKDPCGLTGTFREKFLTQTDKAPRGVKMQGSGQALDGRIIGWAGSDTRDCFRVTSVPTTKSGTTATSGRTVAVSKAQIPLGTELLIEDIGLRTAEDTGGSIGKDHIDVYYGTDKTMAQASATKATGKTVCKKT